LEVQEAAAGEIIAMAGIPEVNIGETIADAANPVALPTISVEEPTIRMTFGVNTSPFAGREGTWVTSRKLKERLDRAIERDVALRVEPTEAADTFLVSGRGELHLAILIETMRREGYEFQVSAPEVIFHDDPDTGERLEPVEEVHVEVPEPYSGVVVEMLGPRKGQMTNMRQGSNGSTGTVYYTFLVPTRGLLGFRQAFLTATRGMGIVHSIFYGFEPYMGLIKSRQTGSLVAWENGISTSYALFNAQERGKLFIGAGVEVYEGMIVGRRPTEEDLTLSVTKKKHLTNHRSSSGDELVHLETPINMSLDDCLEYIANDELVEITPKSIRMRKRILGTEDRKARNLAAEAAA
jgi:GTP-binding protein